jgi:hypothetical protein
VLSLPTGIVTSARPSLLCISSDGHADVIMPVATVPLYKYLDTVPPSSSSDKAQCESRLFSIRWLKNLKKRGEILISFFRDSF